MANKAELTSKILVALKEYKPGTEETGDILAAMISRMGHENNVGPVDLYDKVNDMIDHLKFVRNYLIDNF